MNVHPVRPRDAARVLKELDRLTKRLDELRTAACWAEGMLTTLRAQLAHQTWPAFDKELAKLRRAVGYTIEKPERPT